MAAGNDMGGNRQGTAVVTGSASGIGEAVARRFLTDFHAVAGVDLASQAGRPWTCFTADIRQESWGSELEQWLGNAPPLRAVVHCAGATLDRDLLDTSADDLAELLRVNVVGTHNVVRFAIGQLANHPGGRVVVTTSQLARIPTPRRGAYGAAKAAIDRMVPDYAREAAASGVAVLAVAPGPVLTPMTRHRFADAETRSRTEGRLAGRRLIDPDEVAEVVAMLADPRARIVNGTTVIADDGYLAWG